MTQTYELIQNNITLLQADPYTVREKIEDLLEAKTGVFVSLQEHIDDGPFEFSLHSDADEDISTADWDKLTHTFGIGRDNKSDEHVICQLLDIRIQ